MCLTSPAKIISLKNNFASVEIGSLRRQVNLLPIAEKVKKGDWVLVQANLAIKKISAKESKEILKLFK